MIESKKFSNELGMALGPEYRVAVGMRYGNPSVKSAWSELKSQGIDRLVVFPLYPQYSRAATKSALENFESVVGVEWALRAMKIKPFYEDAGFIDAYAAQILKTLSGFQYDHLIFSYHGLPKQQVKRTERSPHCMRTHDCCDTIGEANKDCYRAQCFATTQALVWKLKIPAQKFTVSFQSRIGSGWIEPFTDKIISQLGSRKAARVAVVCPSFVADCLETLEEVGIRLADQFKSHGGGEIRLVPALNSEPSWVAAAVSLITEASKT